MKGKYFVSCLFFVFERLNIKRCKFANFLGLATGRWYCKLEPNHIGLRFHHGRGECMFGRQTLIITDRELFAQWAEVVEYTDCTSVERYEPPPAKRVIQDMTLNNVIVRFQQCWSFGECGVPLHFHRSQVNSGPQMGHLKNSIYGSNRTKLGPYIYYLPTPPLGQDMTQGQFLSRVYQVWIQTFPFPRLVASTRLKNLVCPTIYPKLEGELFDSYLSQGY